MTDNASNEIPYLAEALLLPPGAGPAIAKIPSPLPNFTILVHGVNDLGETYQVQEEGICKGLNKRLHRTDLKGASYTLPPERKTLSGAMALLTLEDDPDAVYYQRSTGGDVYSPVIPFYWGFKEDLDHVNEKEPHGQVLDRYGNRLSNKGWKNGGPFANATTCLPDMWADGFKNKILGFINLNWFADPIHPLLPAQDRRYMVLAAKRLAALVKIIRKRQKYAAINIVAHSQGCMVSLLSQAMLAEEAQSCATVPDKKAAPVDCLIMNNAPYSLEEFMGMFDRAGLTGLKIQTTHARFETLKNIVNFITANRNTVPSLHELRDVWDVAGPAWEPDPDKEERRGKVFLYFSPDDRTVGMLSPQGIGWKGVPDAKHYFIGSAEERREMLSKLTHFHQRIFTTRARQEKLVEVGHACECLLREHGKPTWEKGGILLKDLPEGESRCINGPPLPEPFVANLGSAKLDVSPVDAAIAITNKGEKKDGDNQRYTEKKVIDDPRPVTHNDMWSIPPDADEISKLLNKDKKPREKIQVIHVRCLGGNKLEIEYYESFESAQRRWQTRETMANSFHSGIVGDIQSSEKAAAYDMAIGITNIIKDRDVMKRFYENKRFMEYLCKVADWRVQAVKDFKKYSPWVQEDLDDPVIGPVIEDNIAYFNTGILPKSMEKVSLPPLVLSESFTYTTEHQAKAGERSLRVAVHDPKIR